MIDRGRKMLLRLIEMVVAGLVLLISSPLLVVIAILIRRDSKGPVLFRQTRLGMHQEPFTLFKFRTFYADARERFPDLYDYRYERDQLQNFTFKKRDDPRTTPIGRVLRRTSLDELPNFWNLLRGDMALVGPRPEIPELLPYYEGEMLDMFTVRPGITGLAQVSGRGDLDFLETVRQDVEYVHNRSLRLDLKIIGLTIVQCLRMEGAF